jgi:L-arabinose isomerase
MKDLRTLEVWFVTGSQHLYGPEALAKVAEHSKVIADSLNKNQAIPVNVVFKPVMTGPDAIRSLCREANNSENCIGLVLWMHTFSPAKMWIAGLERCWTSRFVHLHTQFNQRCRGPPSTWTS